MATIIGAILLIATLLSFSLRAGVRALARIPFRWTFNPANTFAIVVTEDNKDSEGTKGSGNIVDLLHAIPGRVLDRRSSNHMNWCLKKGIEPDHQNFLYRKLGVQDMGSVFYTLRTNVDKRLRYARKEPKAGEHTEELHTVTKTSDTRHVFFTGEMTVKIIESDTKDRIGLDFEIDFIFERKFPVRSILRVADAPAFLTSLVENIVNNKTTTKPVTAYYGGKYTEKHRKELALEIDENEALKKKVLDEIGLDITAVSIRNVTVDAKYKDLLAKKLQAEKDAEAETIKVDAAAKNKITTADAEMQAKMKINTADEDRVRRVIKPLAENDRTVAVRVAEAYEHNETVTTFAPGAGIMLPLPVGKEKQPTT